MPIALLLLVVGSLASIIGAICGIGGGVLIKPILDALGIMSVSSVSFISGCTVFAMAASSIGSSVYRKTANINKRATPALGTGAAIGGILGKTLFTYVKQIAGNENLAGMAQAILLGTVISGTLIYVINKDKIKSYRIQSPVFCVIIGLLLGTSSSFIGIGGGPINMAVLAFFFSMDIKESVTNSLCIILISQAAAILLTIATSAVPQVDGLLFICMLVGGVVGGYVGQRINSRMDEKQIKNLFNIMMVVVIITCIYNAIRFAVE